jgi:hypothetical protein
MSSGFFTAAIASLVVRRPACARSTTTFERLDHLEPEIAQPRVAGLHATIADQVAAIVRELDDAHAALVEQLDAIEVLAERRGFLETVDDAELALALGALQVSALEDQRENIRSRDNLLVPLGDRVERAPKRRVVEPERSLRSETEAHGGEAAFARVAQLRLGERRTSRASHAAEPAEAVDRDRCLVRRPAQRAVEWRIEGRFGRARGQCPALKCGREHGGTASGGKFASIHGYSLVIRARLARLRQRLADWR